MKKISRLTAILIVTALFMAACITTTGEPIQVVELGTSNFTSDINDFSGLIQVDTINEHTSANGVAIDGLTIKDGGIGEDFSVSGALTSTRLFVDGASDADALTVQGYTTQTSELLVLEQSDGTDVVTFTNAGALYLASILDVDGAIALNGATTHGAAVNLEGNQLDLDADNDTSITADTDDQVDFEIAGQDVISFTQPASYFLMDVYLRYPTLEKTADYTLTTQDSGALVTNKGASGEITITLPAATAGLGYCWGVYAAQTVTIQPDASDLIYHLTNSAGDRLQNTGTAGDSVCLYALDGIDWFPMQEEGTWSDAD